MTAQSERPARPAVTDPPGGEPGSVTRLIDHLRSDERVVRDEAVRRIWERYLPRLLALARRHLDPRIRALHDEEDVVQSMGRSFFRRMRRREFDLVGRDDLWALLVTITLNKARGAAQRHRAARRDVRRTRPMSEADANGPVTPLEASAQADDEPTPEIAAALNEALELRLRSLTRPDLRRLALLKLEGYTNREIAEELDCTERSVERKLGLIRKRWE
jgi:RNA polymerase sigma factor (sigma-70 family)